LEVVLDGFKASHVSSSGALQASVGERSFRDPGAAASSISNSPSGGIFASRSIIVETGPKRRTAAA